MAAGLASHWWVILIIVVLLFGAPKLPALARSMGQSLRIFKSEIKTNDDSSTTANKTGDVTGSTNGSTTGNVTTTSSTEPGDTTTKP